MKGRLFYSSVWGATVVVPASDVLWVEVASPASVEPDVSVPLVVVPSPVEVADEEPSVEEAEGSTEGTVVVVVVPVLPCFSHKAGLLVLL